MDSYPLMTPDTVATQCPAAVDNGRLRIVRSRTYRRTNLLVKVHGNGEEGGLAAHQTKGPASRAFRFT